MREPMAPPALLLALVAALGPLSASSAKQLSWSLPMAEQPEQPAQGAPVPQPPPPPPPPSPPQPSAYPVPPKESRSRAGSRKKKRQQRWLSLAEKGMQLFNAGDMRGAAEQLQESAAIGGSLVGDGVYNNLGIALLNLDDAAGAREAFSEALRRKPASMDAHRNLAMLSAQEGDRPAAVRLMADAVAVQPTSSAAWKLLAQLSVDSQREPEAQNAYARALALDPDDTEAQQALAQLDAALGAAAAAPTTPRPAAAPAAAGKPTNLEVSGSEDDVKFLEGVIEEATRAQNTGDHAQASRLWATATRTKPDSAQLFMSRAASEYWAADMNGAAASYLSVVRLDPANYKARIYAGRAMHESRRYDESRAIFREAILVEPNNWEGYNMLGSEIMQCQNHTLMGEAVRAYKHACELQPLDPSPLVNLGHAYREADRLQEAKGSYSDAIAMIHSGDAEGEYAGRITLADGLRIRMAGLLPRVIQSEAAMLSTRGEFTRQITELAEADPPVRFQAHLWHLIFGAAFDALLVHRCDTAELGRSAD